MSVSFKLCRASSEGTTHGRFLCSCMVHLRHRHSSLPHTVRGKTLLCSCLPPSVPQVGSQPEFPSQQSCLSSKDSGRHTRCQCTCLLAGLPACLLGSCLPHRLPQLSNQPGPSSPDKLWSSWPAQKCSNAPPTPLQRTICLQATSWQSVRHTGCQRTCLLPGLPARLLCSCLRLCFLSSATSLDPPTWSGLPACLLCSCLPHCFLSKPPSLGPPQTVCGARQLPAHLSSGWRASR